MARMTDNPATTYCWNRTTFLLRDELRFLKKKASVVTVKAREL
jgi:hypothetical protein